MTQNTLFYVFLSTVITIITYALGEHDPGSAQDWRTSNDFCSPDQEELLIEILDRDALLEILV